MNEYVLFRNKKDSLSFNIEKLSLRRLFILFLATFSILILSLSVGSSFISPIEVIKYLFKIGNTENLFVLETLRLPRALLSLIAGACLAIGGLILQGISRNPLASPDIIGITGGAKVAAIFAITIFTGISIKLVPLFAIIGAAIAAIIIYTLTWNKGINPIRLVLIGIGIDAGCTSLVTMMIFLGSNIAGNEAYIWMTGSIYGANWNDVFSMFLLIVFIFPATIIMSRKIDLQELGDDIATGLGARVQLDRLLLLTISVIAVGTSVAFVGGIGFIGLVAPHITKKIVGHSYLLMIPTAALVGGIILMLADIIARTVFLPLDLPAGIFVSAIGAPFFIYLLYRSKKHL